MAKTADGREIFVKQKLDRFLRAHPPIRFAADMADVYFSKRVSRADRKSVV